MTDRRSQAHSGWFSRTARGASLGILCGIALLVLAGAIGGEALREWGLTTRELAVIYCGGGLLSGVVGGLLWPFQRSRIETLLFAIPTAVPMYVLAGGAIGLSVRFSLGVGVLVGTVYSVVYGGEHRLQNPEPP